MTKISKIEGRGRNSFPKQLVVCGPRGFRRISYHARCKLAASGKLKTGAPRFTLRWRVRRLSCRACLQRRFRTLSHVSMKIPLLRCGDDADRFVALGCSQAEIKCAVGIRDYAICPSETRAATKGRGCDGGRRDRCYQISMPEMRARARTNDREPEAEQIHALPGVRCRNKH